MRLQLASSLFQSEEGEGVALIDEVHFVRSLQEVDLSSCWQRLVQHSLLLLNRMLSVALQSGGLLKRSAHAIFVPLLSDFAAVDYAGAEWETVGLHSARDCLSRRKM